MQTKTDVSKYIVSVSGKDFITFPGLLQEAHALGLKSISTELLTSPSDLSSPVFKSTVTLLSEGVEKTFTGYGDANASNVAPKVKGALLRMAETRSLARALRFACNIDMAALEELDAEENVINHKSNTIVANKTTGTVVNPPVKTTNNTSTPVPTTQTRVIQQQGFQSRPTTTVPRPQLVQRPNNVVVQKTAIVNAPVVEEPVATTESNGDVEF